MAVLPQTLSLAVNAKASEDPVWRLSVKSLSGLSELIRSNGQSMDPAATDPDSTTIDAGTDDIAAFENEVVRLVNVQRGKCGLAPLHVNSDLSCIARYKSQDMANKDYFSHVSQTYGSPFAMMSDFGISYISAGENIAYGHKAPADVMAAWLSSSGHKSNILSTSFDMIGVGVAQNSEGTYYWTQMFIKSC